MTKTKKELVKEVARDTGFTQREIAVIIDSFLGVISQTLRKNDRIELRGFGVFSTRHRKPREARNPKTGKTVNLPARVVPWFKASKSLKKQTLGRTF
ncbi:integration host factor subunit beta [candidate division WOR-3 bacterium]|nr:integration host factor subunit beta [candidate division WOR-3 bacterium]